MLLYIRKATTIFIVLVICTFFSCKKFLEEKPDKKLVTPEKLTDLQAILDNNPIMIVSTFSDEASADNYYLTTTDWNALVDEGHRRMYIWDKDHFYDGPNSDWGLAYRKIYHTNTVLDVLNNSTFSPADQANMNNILGQALFMRGYTFWQIANIWSLAYDSSTAITDLGIPLRLNADFNEVSVRSTVKQTYDQVISDLKASIPLLPVVPIHKYRPSKPAAYGFLSRVYLSMREYDKAGLYADSCLMLSNALLDYNTLNASAPFPFAQFNVETIFYILTSSALLDQSRARIDSVLYNSYSSDDCRRLLFFKTATGNAVKFKGSYSNSNGLFAGVATDEMYLTRAECRARKGDIAAAMADLNILSAKRYKPATFIPFTATGANDALTKILVERRKQLVMRYIRWMDIKRLNKEGHNMTLQRIINNISYSLPPNSPRYALPLPEDVLALSGMPQNPR